MLGTTDAHPSNGNTAANFTTNADGVLPYGEVLFRSAVFDPMRGLVYLGQDNRPNQVVKVQVARINPFTLTGVKKRKAVRASLDSRTPWAHRSVFWPPQIFRYR